MEPGDRGRRDRPRGGGIEVRERTPSPWRPLAARRPLCRPASPGLSAWARRCRRFAAELKEDDPARGQAQRVVSTMMLVTKEMARSMARARMRLFRLFT